jgi:hypothetical protein
MNPLASRECIRAYEQFRDDGVLDGEPLPRANGSGATDWKEATEAAEAWCKITDQEGRNHAVYCFRAGYLKAKRQNQNLSHGDAGGTKP